jgi:hypothetical protein
MNPPDQPTPDYVPDFTTPTLAPTPRTEICRRKDNGETSPILNEMEKLERELAAAKTECERLTEQVQMAAALNKEAESELARLRAEVDRWKTVAAEMSQQREHNANEASRLRAEVVWLKGMRTAAEAIMTDVAEANEEIALARAERAEAERDALAKDKARLDSGQIMLTVAGERVWHCGADLRFAIDAAMKGTPSTL